MKNASGIKSVIVYFVHKVNKLIIDLSLPLYKLQSNNTNQYDYKQLSKHDLNYAELIPFTFLNQYCVHAANNRQAVNFFMSIDIYINGQYQMIVQFLCDLLNKIHLYFNSFIRIVKKYVLNDCLLYV